MTYLDNSSKSPTLSATTTAYLRVSTIDQDLEKNKTDILKLAHSLELGHVHFIEEKVSGIVSWKNRKIAEVLENAKSGDNRRM
jgi:DNA invertase Pin-like site-specific DNA recombinase